MKKVLLFGRSSGGGGTTYLLDTYPATAAYSLRQLKTGITNVARIRRDSDNSYQNFTAEEITDGTLTTWVGAGNGFVETLYDQSGNGYDITQATSTSFEPRIVVGGALEVINTKPALNFAPSGANRYLNNATVWNFASGSFCTVYKENSNGNGSRPFGIDSNLSNSSTMAQACDNSLRYDGSSSAGSIATTTTQKLRFSQRETTQVYDYINTVQNINSTVSLPNMNGTLEMSGVVGTSTRLDGFVQEAIFWSSTQLTNRSAIETDINTYYSIY